MKGNKSHSVNLMNHSCFLPKGTDVLHVGQAIRFEWSGKPNIE